jgi:exodeoxyribonuclease V alpha subunit
VYNGDAGLVEAVGVGPDGTPEEGEKGIAVRIDERLVVYSPETARDLRLAYCVTVHKAQGSEFPVVLLVCHTTHHIMLTRSILYTGLTRARRLLVLCGTRKAVSIATSRAESRARWTGLVKRLRDDD